MFTPDIDPWLGQRRRSSTRSLLSMLQHGNDPENASNGPPFAQIVSQNQFGTYSLNYRNEPVPFRTWVTRGESNSIGPISPTSALAFTSIKRADPDLNIQPDGKTPGYPTIPLVPNAQGTDPYTPMLQAYVNDKVQIRTLVGAHAQAHAFQVHGVKWLFEPDNTNSGWRNAQLMGPLGTLRNEIRTAGNDDSPQRSHGSAAVCGLLLLAQFRYCRFEQRSLGHHAGLRG